MEVLNALTVRRLRSLGVYVQDGQLFFHDVETPFPGVSLSGLQFDENTIVTSNGEVVVADGNVVVSRGYDGRA